ncbi:serine/threonine-protein kinase NIM1-like isoform X2 [Oscarella lobularis]|uniref:serine/threonine-protein kinase NIM1-like isoform X2 n=1 Tax=Oscarella lobularis TaxID=121494 RepID=UPI003313E4FA
MASTDPPPRRASTTTNGGERTRKISAYEKLQHDLENDQRTIRDISTGRRVGLYRVRGELGAGNFSQVKMGIHSLTKERVAIKILDKTALNAQTRRLLSREISSMERLHHPNIIRIYEVVETLTKLHIVMECASGGELFALITKEGRLKEADAKPIFAQVIAGVEHMHEKEIVHRDLKAENVMFTNDSVVKICDFGFSKQARASDHLDTFCGSPPYAAPELFKDAHYMGPAVDIWACGVMLFFMVVGVMPFHAENISKLKARIIDGAYRVPDYVTAACRTLIGSLLKSVPSNRATIAEIRGAAWLDGVHFPESLPPYPVHPLETDGVDLATTLEAHAVLDDYGITRDHLEKTGRDSRNSVTGTYRIVMHQIHRKQSSSVVSTGMGLKIEAIADDETAEKAKKKKSKKGSPKGGRKLRISKICAIL